MKKRDFDQLRTKEVEELTILLKDKKTELIKVATEIAAGKEKNIKKARNKRKEIAKLLTLIREKQILQKEEKTNVNKTQ